MPRLAYVHELTNENLIIQSPQEQKIEKKSDKSSKKAATNVIRYHSSKMLVRDGSEDVEFYLIYPVATCYGGILEKENDDGSINKSIKLTFSANDEEEKVSTNRFLASAVLLDEKVLAHVYENRKTLNKKYALYTEDQMRGLTKGFIYYPLDEEGNVRTDKSPTQYVKLQEFDNFKTKFFDLNDQLVPWELLQNVSFRCIVTARVRYLYHGAKSSIQFQAKQVQIVSSIEPLVEYNMQSKVSEVYRKQNAAVVEEQARTIRELQEKLAKAEKHVGNEKSKKQVNKNSDDEENGDENSDDEKSKKVAVDKSKKRQMSDSDDDPMD